jgi:hypothetical protein
MTYNAIVEDMKAGGFSATVLGWPTCTATGATKAEALARLRQTVNERLSRVEIVPLEIDTQQDSHPLARFAGMFQDDPLFDQLIKEMASYRHEFDNETAE